MADQANVAQVRYRIKAYAWAPITFTRRVLFNRDPYWREYFFNRWGYLPQRLHTVNGQRTLWIDAQSLGEVNQLTTLIQRLKAQLPSWRFVISTNEPSSFKAASVMVDGEVFDEPWDLRGSTHRVLASLRPQALLIIEHPQNPTRLFEAKRHGVRTLLMSADFPPGWQRMPFMQRSLVFGAHRTLDAIAVKTEDDAVQYQRLGVPGDRIRVVGDLKYDLESIAERARKAEGVRQCFQLDHEDRWLVGGSLHQEETSWLVAAWQTACKALPNLRLAIVPRWAEHGRTMASSLRRQGVHVIQRSAWNGGAIPKGSIIVVDSYGELIPWYALAWAVFLGGSAVASHEGWRGLCHNPVEPLSLGKPVFVGPNHHLRQSTCEWLRQTWDGLCVKDPQDLATRLATLAYAPDLEERIRKHALESAQRQQGVVDRYTEWLLHQLAPTP